MFVLFGLMGFMWCTAWICSFKEIRITTDDDDFVIVPPKVGWFGKGEWARYFGHTWRLSQKLNYVFKKS